MSTENWVNVKNVQSFTANIFLLTCRLRSIEAIASALSFMHENAFMRASVTVAQCQQFSYIYNVLTHSRFYLLWRHNGYFFQQMCNMLIHSESTMRWVDFVSSWNVLYDGEQLTRLMSIFFLVASRIIVIIVFCWFHIARGNKWVDTFEPCTERIQCRYYI